MGERRCHIGLVRLQEATNTPNSMHMHQTRPVSQLSQTRGSCKASSHCRRGELGAWDRSLLSLWYMKSGGHRRWPWPHSWVSQHFPVTAHLWTRLSVCLGCGLPSLDIDREKLKWRAKADLYASETSASFTTNNCSSIPKRKLICKSTGLSKNRPVRFLELLSVPRQNTDRKSLSVHR